jgi:hypothetical protein
MSKLKPRGDETEESGHDNSNLASLVLSFRCGRIGIRAARGIRPNAPMMGGEMKGGNMMGDDGMKADDMMKG